MLKNYFFLLLSIILIIFAGCSDNLDVTAPADEDTLQKVSIFCFDGTEEWLEQLDPGTMKISNNKYILTRRVTKLRFQTDTDLMTGYTILTHNAVFDVETGEGMAYGSLVIHPDAYEGTWEGNFHGKTVKTGEAEWTTYSRMYGIGKGVFQGRQMYYNNEIVKNDRPATSFSASGHGCIKENGVKP